eukprot:1890445-Pleurochrysis_carterae.AAC.1
MPSRAVRSAQRFDPTIGNSRWWRDAAKITHFSEQDFPRVCQFHGREAGRGGLHEIGRELLEDTKLREASMMGVNANGITMHDCRLERADLSAAVLAHAEILRSSFDYSKCFDTDFGDAVLEDSTFRGADLRHAHFVGATISRASFSEATCDGAKFINTHGMATADFRGCYNRVMFVGAGSYPPPPPPIV